MVDEQRAIGVLLSACAAELDRDPYSDHHRLLHGIARELESLAEVLNIERQARRSRAPFGVLESYRRVLGLPLARTIRSVLSSHLARLERAPRPDAELDAA